ncbi:MAG: 23S rRNA pseudouridine(955/2504/2580) synthase RluC [Halieaceae bacterium]|mgnify:CR=1 FL=1|jgi:23S rRNA pseudouridine955/2504/2580 synthase|nr:23S rRNA pseudouridine(955/2504/2580) synthase RluC [Halieaceae bacterium]
MTEPKPEREGGRTRHQTIDADSAGQRVDNYLLRELKGVPKARIYRALRKGEVRVNKGRIKADYRLKAGDILRIPPIRQSPVADSPIIPKYWSQQLEDRVIYEDAGLLVINKPSGLAVHGGSGLNYGLIECLRQMRPDERYLELAHRLDRDTSGCILIARKPAVLRDLHKHLREGSMEKRYLALASGKWPKNLGVVDAPLAKNVMQSGERIVKVSREGKPSITEFSVIERFRGATLVEARPLTGRTHQIRVHAQHAGFSLVGDDKYSSDNAQSLAREIGLKRLFLHALSLRFSRLQTGRQTFNAELDQELNNILNKLRN